MAEQNVVDAAPDFGGEASEGHFGGEFEGGADEDGGQVEQPGPGLGQSKSSRRRRRKRKKLATGPGIAGATSAEAGSGDGDAAFAGSGSQANGANGSSTSSANGTNGYLPVVLEGESLALSAATAVSSPAQANGGQRRPMHGGGSSGQNGSQNGSQAPGQGKRWKKKFRDRERRPGADAGASNGAAGGERSFNGASNGGGERQFERPHRREGGRPDNFGNLVSHQGRKAKTGGSKERGFVGPMDHSYREVNPEFGEGPPSTIQMRGRRGQRPHGDNQPLDHNAPRAVPISDDAQTHIYLFIEDLFIAAKVQETARKLGVKVAFIKNEKDAITELTNGEDQNKPSLIVFDLNNANAKPLTLIPKLKTKLKRSASIIGFLSSIQGDLKAKAVEAGCDTVMPKAAFSQNLPNLLRRYGVEETEEVNFNY